MIQPQDALAVGRMRRYDDFLAGKAQLADSGGFEPSNLPGHLFDFQRDLVEWAVRQGRYAIGAELKPSYYEQARRNLAAVDAEHPDAGTLFDLHDPAPTEASR
ncbi:MAG: hypothetical protein QM658_14210 [Gordonia sp. (in: high G+C Gram-positive bacteria)]